MKKHVKQDSYKVKIDKDKLLKFFLLPSDEVTQEQVNEVQKVINVVLIKHYSKYYYLFEELKSAAITAICARREQYNPSFSPYNYCYTVFRNEIGNKIVKYTKEQYVPDIKEQYVPEIKDKIKNIENYINIEGQVPDEVIRYKDYLLGLKEFELIRIPKKDILPLICFFKIVETKPKVNVPQYILECDYGMEILYKLLIDIYNE